eukprot:TRINITY_DN12247_c0_g1_i6.p1 TRINITY_DN12247_c0_g1~~TRINITY_DN12247_c0_g1_i6.p1  ORF type:complete len:156 (+),score=15.10 TRINITY_DN12247_c0_g1_i6:112-579(+)
MGLEMTVRSQQFCKRVKMIGKVTSQFSSRCKNQNMKFRSVNQGANINQFVQEMDVVLYQDKDKYRLGHVLFVDQNSLEIEVEPLSLEDENVWKIDMNMETSQMISFKSIIRTIDAEYGQKQDMNRIKNPHSEHAYEIWQINEAIGLNVYDGGEIQ